MADMVERVSGIQIPRTHFPFLEVTASHRARARGLQDLGTYVHALDQGRLPEEWRALLPLITVKESYFYRTPQHFEGLRQTVIPELVRARHRERRLRIWSAGCARGEEPWSLAMVLDQVSELAGWEWKILATDVDQDALAAGRRARYGERSVRHLPENLRHRYLIAGASGFEIADGLRRRVGFRYHNLAQEPPPGDTAPFDVVFLRNVLIYFAPELQRQVVANIESSLAEDGFLFVGPSETLWPISRTLSPRDLDNSFCYQPSPRTGARGEITPVAARRQPDPVSVPARKVTLSEVAAPPAVLGCPSTAEEPGMSTAAAAADRLAAGDLAAAADDLARALESDPANPEVHALEGLLHDVTGEVELALACYRAALFLDPHLFQVRVLLAQALRRNGRAQRAMGEFRQVLATLSAGRGRRLAALDRLDQPDPESARRSCLEALRTP